MTIINSYPSHLVPTWVGVFVLMIGIGLLSVIFTYISLNDNLKESTFATFVTFACLVVILGILLISTEGKEQHQVLLSKDVNMEEFAKEYEIIGQEGISYIVERKNNGNNSSN